MAYPVRLVSKNRFSSFFSSLGSVVSYSFSKRKKHIFCFLLLSILFFFLGFVFFSGHGFDLLSSFDNLADTAGESDSFSFAFSLKLNFRFLALVICVFLSGFTVFGRIVSVAATSVCGFLMGAFCVHICSSTPHTASDFVLFSASAVCSAFAFFITVLMFCEAFLYSGRAFFGKKELFFKKSFANYVSFFCSSVLILFLTIFTLFLL